MAAVEVSIKNDTVMVIRLNRPEVRNAVNTELAEGLGAALDRLDNEEALRVAIVTGNGLGFCSGMDLGAMLNGESGMIPGRGFAGIVERSSTKPIIAAIEGFAVAGGFEIALSCDILVASKGTLFGLPEVRRGLVASGGGLLRLAVRIPYHVAMEMALTGDTINAERAYSLGLISQLVEPGEALDHALQLAATITSNAPMSINASKAIVKNARDWSSSESFARQAEYSAVIAASEDAREGAAAFKRKRVPIWQGK